ncbi:MAG TPA: TRAP transporter TatT component family protein [Candidatus Binatia bacterium]
MIHFLHRLLSPPALVLGGALSLVPCGCAGLVRPASTRFTEQLSLAILDQDDPQTVKDGAPAFLILIDGLIRDDPENASLLLSGAKLYASYAGAFVGDTERARRLADRAHEYGERALCLRRVDFCAAMGRPYDVFAIALKGLERSDVAALYVWAMSLAVKIQASSQDWNAVADLPKVEAAMERVVELDDEFEGGRAYVYLGILDTLRPAALGGKPAQGRAHFERAIQISSGRDLMAKVMLAKYYARLVFDRDLHDRVLESVLAARTDEPGYTLSNALAKEEARRLLETAADYF